MSAALAVPAWTDQALCAEVGGDLWFSDDRESCEPAKRVCRARPVRAECLDYALASGEVWHGVFGGLSPRERQAERKRRAAAAARKEAA